MAADLRDRDGRHASPALVTDRSADPALVAEITAAGCEVELAG